jgi:hypothetical protein
MASPRTPGEGENVKSHAQGGEAVQEVGAMLWESVKKEWIPASSGNTKDAESAAEALPVQNLLLNQSGTMDRQRNNTSNEIVLASGARTGEQHTAAIRNYNARFLEMFLRITAVGTGTLQLGISPSGEGFNVKFAATALNQRCQMGPGLPTEKGQAGAYPRSEMQSVNAAVPGTFIIWVFPSDGSSWTYEIFLSLLV